MFREAKNSDVELILYFIRELAEYEKMSNQVYATKELINKWIFEEKKAEVIFIMEQNKEIGMALYFYNFSTFLGKPGLYIEDIFIMKEFRNKGYGKKTFKFLAQKAVETGCGRMEWVCLDWNQSSIDFYESLGARQLDEWKIFRLTEENLKNM
ncbi:MAG: GNAT family N-acetyltransferase [Acholeplasma sp.]|nr:GNAT family N-acetyltransferase [Acholeplasma sp.]